MYLGNVLKPGAHPGVQTGSESEEDAPSEK